jgi:ubiquinone biosynthesis protein COQ4
MQASTVLGPGDPLYLPEQAGVVTRAKVALRAFFVLAEDQAHGIAGPVLNMSMDAEVYQRMAAELAAFEDGRALLRERPNLQAGALDVAALAALPEGTLGKALARYYVDNQLSPFASSYQVRSEVEYLAKRYREVHDVLHIVTGYGTDPISELELQAFVFGNLGLRQCVLILTMTALLRPMGLPWVWRYWSRLRAAYERGRRSQNVAVKPRYEHHWASTVEEVRQLVGLA